MSQDLVMQALAALRQKNFEAARDRITAYAEDNPLDFQHYLIKGLAELSLNDWSGARATFEDATRAFPHQAQLWFNLGLARENLGETDAAAGCYERSLDLDSKQAAACGNLSNLYRRRGRFLEAEELAHRAYELGLPKAEALNILGLAVARQGRFDAAAKVLAEARAAAPGDAKILANLANLAVDQLKFDEAWTLFAAARAAGDAAAIRRDEGMARMLAGEHARGWPLYESRLELPNALRARPLCPQWRGESLAGKRMLVVAEQGFGDAIQFCRYGRLLVERGAEIAWLVPQPLERLFAANLPGTVTGEGGEVPAADYWLPMMSLPLALMKPLPADAPPAPYLHAPPEPRLPLAVGKKRIGLVWAGSPTHERDRERSVELERFAPLWKLEATQYYAPFKGAGVEQITSKTPVRPLGPMLGDFADTAALLAQLDALVTVDTASAHLAGALGLKTWLLLPYCPDWRWGTSGETTPWYPGLTLLRQPRYGDWDSVIGCLAEAISSWNP